MHTQCSIVFLQELTPSVQISMHRVKDISSRVSTTHKSRNESKSSQDLTRHEVLMNNVIIVELCCIADPIRTVILPSFSSYKVPSHKLNSNPPISHPSLYLNSSSIPPQFLLIISSITDPSPEEPPIIPHVPTP